MPKSGCTRRLTTTCTGTATEAPLVRVALALTPFGSGKRSLLVAAPSGAPPLGTRRHMSIDRGHLTARNRQEYLALIARLSTPHLGPWSLCVHMMDKTTPGGAPVPNIFNVRVVTRPSLRRSPSST